MPERAAPAPRRGRRVRRFDSDEDEDEESEREGDGEDGDPDDLEEVIEELGDLQANDQGEQPEAEEDEAGGKRPRRHESPTRKGTRRRCRSNSLREEVVNLADDRALDNEPEPVDEVDFNLHYFFIMFWTFSL